MNALSTKITLFLLMPLTCAFAQLKISKDNISLEMNYAVGMQPNTIKSSIIAQRSEKPNPWESNYPKTVGKPADIKKQIEYYYVLNRFQFAYQNYCENKTSKEFFFLMK